MENDADTNSYKALALIGLLFFLAAFKSWQEFRFMAVGRQAAATVTQVVENRSRGRTNGYRLYYNFFNENTQKSSHHYSIITVEDAARYSVGQEVAIDYYGEKYPVTRLHGETNRVWVYLFFGSLTALAAVVAHLSIRSAREDRRPRPAKKSR